MQTQQPVEPVIIDRVPDTRIRDAAAFINRRAEAILPAVKFFEQLMPNNAQNQNQMMRLHIFQAMRQCDQFRTEAEAKLHRLHLELANAREKYQECVTKTDTYEGTVEREQHEISTRKSLFDQKAAERKQLANSLETEEIANVIIIDQRDKANHLFQWVVECIYQEPVSKYYWTNFKNQGLLKDKGSDLKERMANLKISGMTTSSTEATEVLVAEKQLVEDNIKFNMKGVLPLSIETLFKLVENISQSRKIYLQYTEHEKTLKKMVDDHQYLTLEKKKYADIQECVEQRIDVLSKCLVYYNNFLQALLRRQDKMLNDNFVKNVREVAKTTKPDANPNQSLNVNIGDPKGATQPLPQQPMIMTKSLQMTSPDQRGQQQQAPAGATGQDSNCTIF